MNVHIHIVTLFVRDYDEAIQYYTQTLGMVLIEDILITTSRRWVKIAPDLQSPVHILLHVPIIDEDWDFIGHQAGTRPLIVLNTFELDKSVETLRAKGVHFVKPITQEVYGRRAQFKDLYGNLWEIVQYTVFQ
jgi:catechol 2,3-dioxygenase-like lactoylglutathione lyase family enzyme